MAFPVGMTVASRQEESPRAWYWTINGAFSVIASVLAVVIAVFWGVTATLLTGLALYAVALLSLAAEKARAQHPAFSSFHVGDASGPAMDYR
jgi:hypothetical protein